MAHPFASARQHLVEKSRVSDMCKGYATGGAIAEAPGMPIPKRSTGGQATQKIEGRKSGGRLDKFARGGKVKGSTNVNVIVAPQGGGMAAPPLAGAPSPAMMAGPPPIPPGPAGGPPMMQNRGGRAYASGGSVKEQSMKAATPIQHTPGGKTDLGDIYRPKQITYATGGPVEADDSVHGVSAGDNGYGRLKKAAMQKRSKLP